MAITNTPLMEYNLSACRKKRLAKKRRLNNIKKVRKSFL